MTTAPIRLKAPPLLPWQQQVHREAKRFNVLCLGRRAGKTQFGKIIAIEPACQGHIVWWIAPTYSQAEIGWRGIKKLCQQIPGVKIRESDRQAIFPGGGFVQAKTGDDPDNLRGEGLKRIILDEAALLKRAIFTEVLRPALSDQQGDAWFFSTPKGIGNWFHEIYTFGKDPLRTDWMAWEFPTAANPYIDAEEIENARETLPERLFRQEYLAEFIPDSGSVFRNVDAVSIGKAIRQAVPGRQYVAGLDWGKENDLTAFSIWDKVARMEVFLDRFNKISWALQRGRLMQWVERFPGIEIYAEANSIGGPNIEALQSEGLNVVPFTTSSASKGPLIEALALGIEQERVELLAEDYATLELKAYELERLPSGKFRYGAPEGMHDDTVIARALALYGIEQGGAVFLASFDRSPDEGGDSMIWTFGS